MKTCPWGTKSTTPATSDGNILFTAYSVSAASLQTALATAAGRRGAALRTPLRRNPRPPPPGRGWRPLPPAPFARTEGRSVRASEGAAQQRDGAAAPARSLTHPEPGAALPAAAQPPARRHGARGGGGPPAAPDPPLGAPGAAAAPAGRAFPSRSSGRELPFPPGVREPRSAPSRLGAAGGAAGAAGKVRPGAPRGRVWVGAARRGGARRRRDGAGAGGSRAAPSPRPWRADSGAPRRAASLGSGTKGPG